MNAGSARGMAGCGEHEDDDGSDAFFALVAGQILYALQVCLQRSSKDVYRSGMLTPANSILCFIVSLGRSRLSEAPRSPPSQELCTTDQSRTDTVHQLPRRPGGRKLLTCQQALGEVRETFISNWRLHGDLRLQLLRVSCTSKDSCQGGRVHAAGGNPALSSSMQPFLEWVEAKQLRAGQEERQMAKKKC